MKVWCDCGATLTDTGPAALWAFLRAHTTPRIEPVPGVRQEVEVHNLEFEGVYG